MGATGGIPLERQSLGPPLASQAHGIRRRAALGDLDLRDPTRGGRADRDTLQCANQDLRREFAEYVFETDENSRRVGEFAIGTNTGLTHLIYNLLQDEKFPGVHLAFGSSLPAKTGATWDSKAHVDGVLIRPTIYIDGEVIMDKGSFRLH